VDVEKRICGLVQVGHNRTRNLLVKKTLGSDLENRKKEEKGEISIK